MPLASARASVAAALAGLGLMLSACVVPPHPYALAAGHEGAANAQSFMVLPPNVTVALPGELQRGAERVQVLTVDYLRAAGKDVETLGFYAARDLWATAVRDAQAMGEPDQNFETVTPLFVNRVRERFEFDVLVMPNLVYRLARINQGSRWVVWDGVKRELAIRNEAYERGSIYLMTSVGGNMDGVSLHLVVFDVAGERIFESYGGLDLIHEADFKGWEKDSRFRMVLKPDRLESDASLIEGIEVALDPYIPRPIVSEGR